jgi:DNA repair exonuclease SbcCD ATPase subunit
MSEEALEELDVKAILVKQTHELMEIRQQLQLMNATQGMESDSDPQIKCQVCNKVIPESEKESHAKQKHNWATSMGTDALSRFYADD